MNIPRLIISIALCESVGLIGAIFTIQNIPNWYAALNKPSFNPPNWVFGPVWTILYLLMGISLYIIWNLKLDRKEKNKALYFFFMQLALNAIWTFVFFEIHSLFGGLFIIESLWIFILLTILNFQKLNKTAGYLLYPYLAWVTFASVLNLSVALINR